MKEYLTRSLLVKFTPAKLGLSTLAICGFFSLILTNSAMAEEKLSTLTVTGQGIETIDTTLAEVRLGVEIQGKTAAEVQQQVAQKTSAVIDLLRSKNVAGLQTTGIRLEPSYDYSNNQSTLIGYVGTNSVSFRLPSDRVGSLLDETVRAGASRIDEVSFTATPEAIVEAQKAALRKATLDARGMADVVLKTLNLTSQEVVSIKINDTNFPPPMPLQLDAVAKGNAEAITPVIGGEQKIQASVTLQISY
jgi:uncharacterized protein